MEFNICHKLWLVGAICSVRRCGNMIKSSGKVLGWGVRFANGENNV